MSTATDELRNELNKLIEISSNLINKSSSYKWGCLNQELYQYWYTKALPLINFLVPDRSNEFENCYRLNYSRKSLTPTNYTILDYMNELRISGYPTPDESTVMKVRFDCQLGIIKGAVDRINSIVGNLEGVLQADLFQSELDAAEHLLKNGYLRAAGAIAGVVLEGHLKTICKNHNITITNKTAGISLLNDELKKAGVYDTSQWRRIQFLGDIRNKCDHKQTNEPIVEDIEDLISGVTKVINLVF